MADTSTGTPAAAIFHDPKRLHSSAEAISVAGCTALDEITALCSLALNAMESHCNLFDPEDLALALQVIQARAIEQRDFMLAESESIGIDASTPRTVARSKARTAAFKFVRTAQTHLGA